MKRRSFIKYGGIATATVATAATQAIPKPAIAQGTKELRMVTSWPKNFPGLGTAATRFAQRIENATQGRYKIRVYAGGELVPALKCLDAVQEGTADLYHSADYYYIGKNEGFAFYGAVPFGFTANEQDAWLYHGGGQELWDELSAEFNVKPFACANTGVQMGGWFRKKVNSIDDLKGLKMRMPGLGGAVLNAIGATALTLPGAEIMPALQSGTIDATEWVGPWNDLAFGFYKVTKEYYTPGFHEPGTTLSVGISKQIWDQMSNSDQEIFRNCAQAENSYGYAEFNANNALALNTLVNKHGVTVNEFSDDIFKAFGDAAKDVINDAGKSSPIAGKIYDSFSAFRKNVTQWSEISDTSYVTKRKLVQF